MKTITEGSEAPDFELPDQDGKPVALSTLLLDGPVVLFFYPAAMTPGCTKEACHFRDLAADFAELGARRVGISTDTVDRQKQFVGAHGLDFTLLSDADGAVATAYGVRRRLLTPVKRATIVVDTDRTVLRVIASELNMEVHADRALEALRSRSGRWRSIVFSCASSTRTRRSTTSPTTTSSWSRDAPASGPATTST